MAGFRGAPVRFGVRFSSRTKPSDFSRLSPTTSGLFLADADGKNEHPLLPASGLDYNASYSKDGKWILFTSERGGSADVYRVHPDGSGLQQLTSATSYDDQAALSPDGRTLAFVSTRGSGNRERLALGPAQPPVHQSDQEL